MGEPLSLRSSLHDPNGCWQVEYLNSLRQTALETSSTGYRRPICGLNGGVPLPFLSSVVDRHSTLMAKNVDDSLVNGRSGCQDWLRRTILLWNTPLRFFDGAPPANIGHPPKVGFTVLRRVGFACFWLLLP